MDKEKIVNALAILADMYMTEAKNKSGLYELQAFILEKKAEAVKECIELLEELNI